MCGPTFKVFLLYTNPIADVCEYALDCWNKTVDTVLLTGTPSQTTVVDETKLMTSLFVVLVW